MYQSFPQKHISKSASAMPVFKEIPKVEELTPQNSQPELKKIENQPKKEEKNPLTELFQGLNIDDIIIIGLIVLLIYEGTDDYLTIGLLAAVLLF